MKAEDNISSDDEDDNSQDLSGLPVDPVVMKSVGKQLNHMFQTTINDPVPDRFAQLLAKLEAQMGNRD